MANFFVSHSNQRELINILNLIVMKLTIDLPQFVHYKQFPDGFKYFEAVMVDGSNLIAFSVVSLVGQLKDIHGIDLEPYLWRRETLN